MTTKEKILETALDLFSEKGFDGASMRDIARGAGLTVAALYNHFAGKNELLQAVYDHFRAMFAKTDYAIPGYGDLLDSLGPLGLLEYLTNAFVRTMRNDRLVKLTRVIVMEQYKNPVAAEIAFRDRRALLSAMEGIFALMREKGYLREDAPPSLGTLVGYAYLGFSLDNMYYSMAKGRNAEELAREQNRLVSDLLCGVIIFKQISE